MKLLSLLSLVMFVLALAGCKNRAVMVQGKWSSPKGSVVEIRSDQSFTWDQTKLKFVGAWKFDGDDVVLTPLTLNGIAIDDMKERMIRIDNQKHGGKLASALEDIDKPEVMKLSDDGKQMVVDKAKDTNKDQSLTLTKTSD